LWQFFLRGLRSLRGSAFKTRPIPLRDPIFHFSEENGDIIFAVVISEAAMVRTVISLDEEDKRWLDEKASSEGIPMTEVIRRAVRHLRSTEMAAGVFDELLQATSGIGSGEDGLKVQRRLRNEWNRRSA
jgi:Arc/MetJ-type ribon-helix-helix transcriptional regulator